MIDNINSDSTFNVTKLFKSVSTIAEDTKTQILSQFSDAYTFYTPDDDDDDNDDNNDDNNNDIPHPFHRRSYIKVLSPQQLQQALSDISTLARYLRLSPVQTIVFVAYLTGEMLDEHMDDGIGTVKRFLRLDGLDCIPIKAEIKYLIDHGYLIVNYTRRSSSVAIDKVLLNAIASNSPFAISEPQPIDRYVFCQKVSKLTNDNEFDTQFLMTEVRQLEKEFESLRFVREVNNIITQTDADTSDAIIFYCVCNAAANGQRLGVSDLLSDIYSRPAERIRNCNELADGIHPLQKVNLIDITPGGFLSDTCLALTEKGRRLFLENDYRSQTQKFKDVIPPCNIKNKPLFYDADTTRQVDLLRETLDNKKFLKMQKRLEQKALPKGIAILLYGGPGTGKTETALQIAKATGRRIMHVDISQTKSCWFGESEKIIKKIFSNYKELCKLDKLKPILLFNEADAIFTKRKDVSSSTTSQTINTIQNIILEEMESLDGILIATTNLADNIDEAFDRRFLFKLQFNRPTAEAKQAIWKSKLPDLSDDECLTLAHMYDLSGGEIDNIVRKSTINQVLHGGNVSFNYISKLCKEERSHLRHSSGSRIGFNN